MTSLGCRTSDLQLFLGSQRLELDTDACPTIARGREGTAIGSPSLCPFFSMPSQSLFEPGMVAYTCSPSSWEEEPGRLCPVREQPWLHGECQVSLGFSVRSCLLNKIMRMIKFYFLPLVPASWSSLRSSQCSQATELFFPVKTGLEKGLSSWYKFI